VRGETTRVLALPFVALLSLVALVVFSFDFGITWDEPISQEYGKAAGRFYLSGFRDGAAVDHYSDAYHGALFQMICAAAARAVPFAEFDVRHVCTAIVGWIGIVYAARTAGSWFRSGSRS
jgi:hypothetical protein